MKGFTFGLFITMCMNGCAHNYKMKNQGNVTRVWKQPVLKYEASIMQYHGDTTYFAETINGSFIIPKSQFDTLKVGDKLMIPTIKVKK